jgi:hypothetical protein
VGSAERCTTAGAVPEASVDRAQAACVARPLERWSVAGVVGLSVGSFGGDEACSWIKGKVGRWRNDNGAGVVELGQHLECLPLAYGICPRPQHGDGGRVS